MQGGQDFRHSQGQRPERMASWQSTGKGQHSTGTDAVYLSLLPHVRHCLEVVVQNEFEESTAAVTTYVQAFVWPDGAGVAEWVPEATTMSGESILRGRILEVFAYWVREKSKELDYMIFTLQTGQHALVARAQNCKRQLEQACYQTSCIEILAEFVFSVVVDIVGKEGACLGSLLAGQVMNEVSRTELIMMCEWPSSLLSIMVCKLAELQAKVSKIVMELYHESHFQTYDESKNSLMMFFPFYTVETTTGTLEVHEGSMENTFAESPFRVQLIDNFGLLLKLLTHLELLVLSATTAGHEVTLAVDFEGVKLCRHGALCLVQMTVSDDPTLVYVLDIHILGRRAFTMSTPEGTSMKGIFENEVICKVWFDPRNDVDALYHQFGIMPRGIFDLQLAEVADRRNRGLNVHFVQGLYKCLTQCPALGSPQKVFAQKINDLGKSLFEPLNGGNYEIFQQRPLNPVILVYAAHDSRYMLLLYEQYLSAINENWAPRVLRAGQVRAEWCLNQTYVVPNSDAPEF